MITDITGRDIQVDDVVIHTGVGAGRNLPPLRMGKVLYFTKSSVTLQPLNFDGSVLQRKVFNRDLGQFEDYTVDTEPVNVRHYPNRFYIT